jgi:uncharacterized membrane protein
MLPAPDDLDRYARHLPDAAERLLSISEREQTHRHELENHLAAIDARVTVITTAEDDTAGRR